MNAPAPFSRTGGKSLGGLQRSIRTDRGSWAIAYKGIPLDTVAQSVWGLRFALTFVWDPRRPFFRALDLLGF